MATDENLNEDWIKTRSWDLGFTDLAGLFRFEGVSEGSVEQQRAGLQRFMNLAAWEAAPDQLKAEAGAWLLRNQ